MPHMFPGSTAGRVMRIRSPTGEILCMSLSVYVGSFVCLVGSYFVFVWGDKLYICLI